MEKGGREGEIEREIIVCWFTLQIDIAGPGWSHEAEIHAVLPLRLFSTAFQTYKQEIRKEAK